MFQRRLVYWLLNCLLLVVAGRPLCADAGDAGRLSLIRPMVEEAIAQHEIPGAVVLISHGGKRVFFEAIGHRSLRPERLPMMHDTVFDMASITKPVATATSVMILLERGAIRLHDPVARHLPEFANNGKEPITVYQCLTHQAGFVPDSPLSEYADPDQIWPNLFRLGTQYQPGSDFVYSDVGFQILGELVHRVSGVSLDEFARQHIFVPLGMSDTGFCPADAVAERCAVTEQRPDQNGQPQWMRGEVHDPRAYAMGGVAGHAGLFSTAADLERYGMMMLGRGQIASDSKRIMSPVTLDLMTRNYRSGPYLRGLGWDKRSKYSTNRSALYSPAAFGHGGFTGTAMWVDPHADLIVIVLSNRVHPDGKGTVNRLAGRIGSVAASYVANQQGVAHCDQGDAATATMFNANSKVRCGIDQLLANDFAALSGRRIGLITNHTGRDVDGRSTVTLLHKAQQVDLVCLFSPEHGIQGALDQSNIADSQDPETGVPIYSLYGARRTPSQEQTADIDTVVFDIQDIGTRYYTYVSTMGNAMRVAAERNLRFVVLDRPNPIGGHHVNGPVLDRGRESFVGFHTLPVRHGMTTGELAKMFADELELPLDLQIVQVKGWHRKMQWDATGLTWINPSPNMRNENQALLYAGIGLLETTNLSVGRGTDTPFEILGAPWIRGRELAAHLNDRMLGGVRFVPVEFRPTSSKYQGESCQGVRILITRRDACEPLRIGIAIACQLRDDYGDQWQLKKMDRLLCDQVTLDGLIQGHVVARIESAVASRTCRFLASARKIFDLQIVGTDLALSQLS